MGRSSDAVIILVADHLDELARNAHDVWVRSLGGGDDGLGGR